MPAKVTYHQLGAHGTARDCWVALCGTVYDLTSFAASHPGGAALLTDCAGTDGTALFLDAHEPSILAATLTKAELAAATKGELDTSSAPLAAAPKQKKATAAAAAAAAARHPVLELLKAVLLGLGRGIVARPSSAAASLTRTSLLLVAFLVVHLLGNFSAVFGGAGAFNAYADALAANRAMAALELYLGAAFALHAGAGLALTFRKRRAFVARGGPTPWLLLLTGLASGAFLVVHILDFRFAHGVGRLVPGRDLHALAVRLLAGRPGRAALYAAGCCAVCAHVWVGWAKAVHKLGMPQTCVAPALALGRAATLALAAGFCVVVAHFHFHDGGPAQGGGGGGGGFAALLPSSLSPQQQRDALLALVAVLATVAWRGRNGGGGGASKKNAAKAYGRVTAELVAALRGAAAADRVHWSGDDDDSAGAAVLEARSKDMSFHAPHAADAVVFPRSTAEVAAVVRLCAARRVPVTPRGAGSGLEGAAIPCVRSLATSTFSSSLVLTHSSSTCFHSLLYLLQHTRYLGGVVLDMMRMKDIELLADDLLAVVQPGVKKLELARFLAPHGLLFGPDPASNPSVGGMASTGGSGLSTVKYGTTKENVVSLTVVTPAGEAVRTRQRVRKSSTGYELTQLYLGSEGTLGVITELTLKLHPILATRCGAFVAFPAIKDAARATVGLLREQLATLVRCECLNADGVAATNKKFGTALDAVPTLFLEFQSNERASGLRDAGVAEAVARKCGCTAWSMAEDGAALDTLWAARRGCYLVSCTHLPAWRIICDRMH